MTSYQRLKNKVESLENTIRCMERDLNIFKNALTYVEVPKIERNEDGQLYRFSMNYVVVPTKKLDEYAKHELSRWVAINLDKATVMELLALKEKL